MSERLVTVKKLLHAQAHIWKHELESAGIPAFISYERWSAGGCELQVRERDVAKAQTILKDVPSQKISRAKRSNTLAFLVVGCISVGIGSYLLAATTYFMGGIVLLSLGIGSLVVFVFGFFFK